MTGAVLADQSSRHTASNSSCFAPAVSSDDEVLIARIFDAPRDRVFAAWIDPEQVAV